MAPWAQRKLLGSASPTGGFAVGNTLPQAGVAASSAVRAYFFQALGTVTAEA
jgi:hypothetical protein